MISKEYPRIGEKIYHAELPNGLHVYVNRRPEFQKSCAFSATNYGGTDMKFRLGDQWRDILVGVTHSLEYEMFDTKDGNALQDLTADGASPNAFASSALTGYYFESTEESYDNLKVLLSFASTPWFTQENADKEQGIIGRKIRMVEDDPDNQVFYGLVKYLFGHHPTRVPIAGTQESISHITADTLYTCHKAFYTPFSMVLTMAGDMEPEEVVHIAREILPRKPSGHVERGYGGEEDGAAAKPEKELRMEVPTLIFQLGFKAEPAPAGGEHLCRQLMGELVYEALLGNSNPLCARLYGEDLVNKNFGYGFELYPGCALVATGGENYGPHVVRDAVLVEEARIAQEGVDEGLFRRLKEGMYGAKVWDLNPFENVYIEPAQAHFTGVGYLTFPEVFDGIPKVNMKDCIRRWITPGWCGPAVVWPGEEA